MKLTIQGCRFLKSRVAILPVHNVQAHSCNATHLYTRIAVVYACTHLSYNSIQRRRVEGGRRREGGWGKEDRR